MAPDQQLVTEIARCTKVKKFRGRLTEGAARKLPQVKPLIRIAVVGPSSVRLMGYRVIFEHESGFDLVSASLPDMDGLKGIDLVILSNWERKLPDYH
jgi:hypothetical protein